ncbi:MAG TPA: ester cyclase, partial [Nitrospira sp.]|nr:ester cyclase [Nitrospira sp.]
WGAAKEVLAADTVYDEVATQRNIQGVEEVISAWKGWAKAFPDGKGSLDKETVSGNTVVLELTWRATQAGPLQLPGKDLAATGKKVELRACQIIEVSGDKVKSLRHYFDLSSLLRQLG